MEYNTGRNLLAIREYGRNIQKMVDYVLTVEDREKRTQLSNSIIKVMSQISPMNRDNSDYTHKLWDHLYIMSDFKLEVDSPFPAPERFILEKKPTPLTYPKNKIKFKPYGKTIELMIKKASLMEEGAEKHAFVESIANHLKKQYLNWNRDSVNDELIIDHLEILSEGKLKLRENFKLTKTHEIISQNRQAPLDSNKPMKPSNYKSKNYTQNRSSQQSNSKFSSNKHSSIRKKPN